MNCREAILKYMESQTGSAYHEWTVRELADRVGRDAQGDGPEYSIRTIRRALTELFRENKVSRRRVGNQFLWCKAG